MSRDLDVGIHRPSGLRVAASIGELACAENLREIIGRKGVELR